MRLIQSDRQSFISELERELPKQQVFKGGLDNGMSDQMHGYNVCLSEVIALLEKFKGEK
jgi:hypothetical protein